MVHFFDVPGYSGREGWNGNGGAEKMNRVSRRVGEREEERKKERKTDSEREREKGERERDNGVEREETKARHIAPSNI